MGIDLHDYQTTSQIACDAVGHRRSQRQAGHGPFQSGRCRYRRRLSLSRTPTARSRESARWFPKSARPTVHRARRSVAGQHVATVEHLMAALFGLGIDNVVDRDRRPRGADPRRQRRCRSSRRIDQAGIETLPVKRRYIRVLKPVRIENGASWAEFQALSRHALRGRDRFREPGDRPPGLRLDIDADIFRHDVARARTFGFMKDVERLWAAGYALGSSLENSRGDRRRQPHHQHGRAALSRRVRAPQDARRDGRPGAGRRPFHRLLPLAIAAATG